MHSHGMGTGGWITSIPPQASGFRTSRYALEPFLDQADRLSAFRA